MNALRQLESIYFNTFRISIIVSNFIEVYVILHFMGVNKCVIQSSKMSDKSQPPSTFLLHNIHIFTIPLPKQIVKGFFYFDN